VVVLVSRGALLLQQLFIALRNIGGLNPLGQGPYPHSLEDLRPRVSFCGQGKRLDLHDWHPIHELGYLKGRMAPDNTDSSADP
jgi:hypothetical protein